MGAGREQKQGKPFIRARLLVLALVLTLVLFGIIGALVTLLPQAEKRRTTEGKVPQARQIDRKTFERGAPAPP